MAHHKRRRPKSTRAGCLLCHPEKDQRRKDSLESQTWQERRARVNEQEQIAELREIPNDWED